MNHLGSGSRTRISTFRFWPTKPFDASPIPAEAEKQALLDRLARPSGLSDDEVMEKAAIIVNRAVENGMTSVQVFRFPNHICTDNERAINQVEDGWEQTLTGVPKEIYEFWKRQLKPRGYHIRYEIIDYPGGMPGDVGIFLSWR
jgi:hypothetical protein